jgi:wyosine [tRNA(Phe)-imidazoG37] synthetase (radical SAM superfamily)
MNKKKSYQFIYGPVSSWRIGRSLGVDIISSRKKACTFNCLYCQLGSSRALKPSKRIFVPVDKIIDELKSAARTKIDYLTFSGMGEPTLAANLKEAIVRIKKLKVAPIAVLTNASLIHQKSTREALSAADFVICKLDAYSQKSLRNINKPVSGIKFKRIVNGILEFKKQFRGKLGLQIMFISQNKDALDELKGLIRRIRPDEVQINTPLRPSQVKPLSKKAILKIKDGLRSLKPIKLLSVYSQKRKKTSAINAANTMKRRGTV